MTDPDTKRLRRPGPRAWLALVLALLLAALYVPVIHEGAILWITNDNYAHGVFIFPIAIALVWLQRRRLLEARQAPTAWGLPVLAAGLLIELLGYVLQCKGLEIASLVPSLAGAVLILHGWDAWRLTSFPICFLVFAARLPGALFEPLSHGIQRASSIGAAALMSILRYPILRSGSIIQLPGMTLDVADASSGFKKLIALVAFAFLYGYLLRADLWKRVVLVISAVPIAVVANIVRVSLLIAVTARWGDPAFHLAHNSAELLVLVISFFLFVGLGKRLGCETTRFSP